MMPPSPYVPPDFNLPPFVGAPEARFAPAPRDGVLPDEFYVTSNLPTWVYRGRRWEMPVRPRMDGAIVLRDNYLVVMEPRLVKAGELVLLGSLEDGSHGIVTVSTGFLGTESGAQEFRFMGTAVSRERPVNYQALAQALETDRQRGGFLIWVVGPALVHSRARQDFEWFIRGGYVQAVLAGNAVAVHDIEAALFGTTLGMSDSGSPAPQGHSLHVRAINRIRQAGSIEAAVREGTIKKGIMHTLVTTGTPYILAGSIRDDGPLPGVITDAVQAQDAMREYCVRATGAVFLATALHAIAVGNLLPAYHTHWGTPEPMLTICVDQTEFVVNKLRDRGTHQAHGVVTNAQDFMHVLRSYTEQCRSQS